MSDNQELQEFELHFQEMFNGEEAEIALNGALLARLSLKTRMQTGLAAVHRFKARPGSSLTISAGGFTTGWNLKAGESQMGIRLEDGGLSIKPVPGGHGYL